MNADNRFVNYAHRGASSYTPENTMLAFYTAIYMGANGLETDVRVTADGVPVLFHDDTLDRLTGVSGKVEELTFAQLQQLDVQVHGKTDKIPSLEDFLSHFAHRDITFAIELKGEGVEQITADMLRKYAMQDRTVVTSFELEYLQNFHALAPEFETAYISKRTDDLLAETLHGIGSREVCLFAADLDRQLVQHWRDAGFRVRAWGVRDEELMKHACACGVDGMTVNFPDKLTALVAKDC